MKITVELETDEEKAIAKRFLDNDETPQTFTFTESRFLTRVLLALRLVNKVGRKRDQTLAEARK